MKNAELNIVQAEFFHVGGTETPTFEALLEECRERVKEGLELVLRGHEGRPHIKTVVRFFDETGELTRLALKADQLKRRDKKILDGLVSSTGLRRWFLNLKSRRLAGQTLALQETARLLAAHRLRDAIKASRTVAVEKFDHSFRLVRKDELHELAESATNSRNVWLFVFRPNNLLSDTNTPVASVM